MSRETKRRTTFAGLPINVEFDVGDVKRGRGWETRFEVPYGEIDETLAQSDGDPVDVYLCSSDESCPVYVVHQLRRDGSYDEDKVMLGAHVADIALAIYYRHHSGAEWAFGSMERMTLDQFKSGYLASNRAH